MQSHSKLIVGVLVGVAVLAAFGVPVLAAFGVPVLAYLPLLAIFAVCGLMMSLMMRMDHGSSRDQDDADTPQNIHRH